MILAFGCDHIVTPMKDEIVKHFAAQGHTIIDCGTYNETRTHYPIYGREVAINVVKHKADLGVVLCGTGVGISNSASKVKGSRCILVTSPQMAIKAKELFNANIIAFGGRVIGVGTAIDIIEAFIKAKYQGKNKDLIDLIDNKMDQLNDDPKLFEETLCNWTKGKYTNKEKQDLVPMPENKLIKKVAK